MLPICVIIIYMKKVSKKKLIELLKNKGNYTYKDLALLTGYHPKSLIRLNSKLKQRNYILEKNNKLSHKKKIVNDYLKSKYKFYNDFYDNEVKYNISYSTLCKILKDTKVEEEIVLVRKVKNKGKYYFKVIDYKTESVLFYFDSLKNDKKSFKKIFYFILNNFGAPDNISFINFFKFVPLEIQGLLDKYNVNVLPFKSVYRNIFNNLSKNIKNINYKKVYMNKEDFYDSKVRKTIDDNVIQFENNRYTIKCNNKIKKNEIAILFYNEQKDDLFIKYKDIVYELILYKNLESKKGNTKYN